MLVDHWGPVGEPSYQFCCGFLQLCFQVMPVDVVNVIGRGLVSLLIKEFHLSSDLNSSGSGLGCLVSAMPVLIPEFPKSQPFIEHGGGQVGGPCGAISLGCFEFLVLEMPVLVEGPLSCQSAFEEVSPSNDALFLH